MSTLSGEDSRKKRRFASLHSAFCVKLAPMLGFTMNFDETLIRIRAEAFEHGELTMRAKDSINDVVEREHVSEDYGMYVISGCHGEERETIYIGKAGTVCQNGRMKKQGLRKRLAMKQNGVYRKELFPKVMKDNSFNALHIEWFVTYRGENGIPPFLAEAELIAAFLVTFHCLPLLNKSA